MCESPTKGALHSACTGVFWVLLLSLCIGCGSECVQLSTGKKVSAGSDLILAAGIVPRAFERWVWGLAPVALAWIAWRPVEW